MKSFGRSKRKSKYILCKWSINRVERSYDKIGPKKSGKISSGLGGPKNITYLARFSALKETTLVTFISLKD